MAEKNIELRRFVPHNFLKFRSRRIEGSPQQQKPIIDYTLYAFQETNLNALVKRTITTCKNGLNPAGIRRLSVQAHLDLTAFGCGINQKKIIFRSSDDETRTSTTSWLGENVITVPVTCKNGTFGYLIITAEKEIEFTASDMGYLQLMGNIFGLAAEKIINEETLIKRAKEAEEFQRHQEILTREVSHRVKNSFHLLGGLLSIQSQNAREKQVKQAIDEAVTRIYTIAQVYDELWQHNDVETLNLKTFLGNLCTGIHATAPNYSLMGDVAPITVKADQAITIALLCNELITNAVKYAYPMGNGQILVKIVPVEGKQHLCLEVRDYGVGLPDGFTVTEESGLGLKLAASLSRQLGGEPKWEKAHPGTRFMLEFPL